MKKVLIASVGGSLELIKIAIEQADPDFAYFLCSTGKTGSDRTLEETILPNTKLVADRYAIERVESPDDLRDVLAACARIEADLDERFSATDVSVVVNYTGGTKTMSVGLGVLAQRHGWDAEVTERPRQEWVGPVSSILLEQVTVFEHLDVSFSKGVNVIIGENGTGKTHMMKCMYGLLRASEEGARGMPMSMSREDKKLGDVFGGPYRKMDAPEGEVCRVKVECEKTSFEYVEKAKATTSTKNPPRVLFFPSREPLAMYPGFVALYKERKLSFDATYGDICEELSQPELREPRKALTDVIAELERIIGGSVRLDVDTFIVDTPIGPVRAPMVAEGHRKLAALTYLIKNGALTEESTLFWDEPESNLNPTLVPVVARVIRTLANAGIQIFVATHDDLLARELSMAAEYNDPPVVDLLFVGLHRNPENGAIEVETGMLFHEIENNPIIEAYRSHYQRERERFFDHSAEEKP